MPVLSGLKRMFRYLEYDYVSKYNGCRGVLYDEKLSIYDPDGNLIFQQPWHCGDDSYSKWIMKVKTDEYPLMFKRLKQLEEDVKNEFGIDE